MGSDDRFRIASATDRDACANRGREEGIGRDWLSSGIATGTLRLIFYSNHKAGVTSNFELQVCMG